MFPNTDIFDWFWALVDIGASLAIIYSVIYAAFRNVRIDRFWAGLSGIIAVGFFVLRAVEYLSGK